MKLSYVGVDLAKNVFQLHGIDRHGQTVWRRRLRRHSHNYQQLQVSSCDSTFVRPGRQIFVEVIREFHCSVAYNRQSFALDQCMAPSRMLNDDPRRILPKSVFFLLLWQGLGAEEGYPATTNCWGAAKHSIN
jgi:hypothetical protein